MKKNSFKVTVTVLVILFVVSLSISVYFGSKYNMDQTTINKLKATQANLIKKPDIYFEVTKQPQPVYPGNFDRLMISTGGNYDCSILVDYESGPSQAKGLYSQRTQGGAIGMIWWDWYVGSDTTPGTWPIYITCSLNGQSATVSSSINVL